MNWKWEINYLNINNYPYMEEHFESMAKKGWMIRKVMGGVFFIYEKICPKSLEFSITPYEMETLFTKKTKEELEEFHSVSERVGWEFVLKSFDLHVYVKEKGKKTVPLTTDEEEEFQNLEMIAKRYLKGQYVLLPILLLSNWFAFGLILNSVEGFKNGMIQWMGFFFPIALILSLLHIVDLRHFVKVNRENVKQGKSLEFSKKYQKISQLLMSLCYLLLLVMILYILYSILVLKNGVLAVSLLPLLIGLSMGMIYRNVIKPWRKNLLFKKGALVLTFILTIVLTLPTSFIAFDVLLGNHRELNAKPCGSSTIDREEGVLRRNRSLLVPVSYETVCESKKETIRTEYAKTLTEKTGEKLVVLYVKKEKEVLIGQYAPLVEKSFKTGIYEPSLQEVGLTKEAFEEYLMQEHGKEKAWERIYNESITEDSANWDVDEAYYLRKEKDVLVLRRGREVFYFEGVDCTKPHDVDKVKEILQRDES
ncbi:MAG: DUF2812 domain-containing protein [Tissierellia bacterium]|nr:DUF2812 domain-containing protein [Tissierellia bacterium]